MLIFAGRGRVADEEKAQWKCPVYFTESGCVDDVFFGEVIVPHIFTHCPGAKVLVYDAATCHLTGVAEQAIYLHGAYPLVIPGHLTQHLQACDIYLFSRVKAIQRRIVAELRGLDDGVYAKMSSREQRVVLSTVLTQALQLVVDRLDLADIFVKLGYWRPTVGSVRLTKLPDFQFTPPDDDAVAAAAEVLLRFAHKNDKVSRRHIATCADAVDNARATLEELKTLIEVPKAEAMKNSAKRIVSSSEGDQVVSRKLGRPKKEVPSDGKRQTTLTWRVPSTLPSSQVYQPIVSSQLLKAQVRRAPSEDVEWENPRDEAAGEGGKDDEEEAAFHQVLKKSRIEAVRRPLSTFVPTMRIEGPEPKTITPWLPLPGYKVKSIVCNGPMVNCEVTRKDFGALVNKGVEVCDVVVMSLLQGLLWTHSLLDYPTTGDEAPFKVWNCFFYDIFLKPDAMVRKRPKLLEAYATHYFPLNYANHWVALKYVKEKKDEGKGKLFLFQSLRDYRSEVLAPKITSFQQFLNCEEVTEVPCRQQVESECGLECVRNIMLDLNVDVELNRTAAAKFLLLYELAWARHMKEYATRTKQKSIDIEQSN